MVAHSMDGYFGHFVYSSTIEINHFIEGGWFKRNVDLLYFVGHYTDVRLTYMAARCFLRCVRLK